MNEIVRVGQICPFSDRDPGDEDDATARIAAMVRYIERALAEQLRPIIHMPITWVTTPPMWPVPAAASVSFTLWIDVWGPTPPDHDPGDEDRGVGLTCVV